MLTSKWLNLWHQPLVSYGLLSVPATPVKNKTDSSSSEDNNYAISGKIRLSLSGYVY